MMQTFWIWVGNISALLGLVGTLGALLAWQQAKKISVDMEREKQRLNQEVFIILQSTEDIKRKIKIPFALRRGEINRQEILGLIGMLPMHTKGRYEIRFLSTEDFRKEMSRIQDGRDIFVCDIPCSNAELSQFNFPDVERT